MYKFFSFKTSIRITELVLELTCTQCVIFKSMCGIILLYKINPHYHQQSRGMIRMFNDTHQKAIIAFLPYQVWTWEVWQVNTKFKFLRAKEKTDPPVCCETWKL